MTASAPSIELFSPAKVNLYLAITGLREDGFHALLSLVAPLAFGDDLTARYREDGSEDTLVCNFPEVPTGPENLVLRAASALREVFPFPGSFHFELKKRTPAGAGLGGGSSNAASALLAMNNLLGNPLDENALCEMASKLGSDCPLFVGGKATAMSGRGERLHPIAEAAREVLSGRRIVLFRPDFGISTAWAYGRMKAANGGMYLPADAAEQQLEAWLQDPNWETLPLFNNMQEAAFSKYLALPAVLELIREKHGLRCLMSGSGSCCFALPPEDFPGESLKATVLDALGENCFYADTRLA